MTEMYRSQMFSWPTLRSTPPPPSIQHVRMASSLSFLATILLKMNQSQSLTDEELQTLQQLQELNRIGSQPSPSSLTGSSTQKISTTKASENKSDKKANSVKKIVFKKPQMNQTSQSVADSHEHCTTTNNVSSSIIEKPYRIQLVNPSLCQARKVNDKEFIPGTEANKVYAEIQCVRKKQTDSEFCKFCSAIFDKWKTSGGKEKKWAGCVNEPIPDNLHILESKWFKNTYPHGIPTVQLLPSSTDVVLNNSVPLQTVEWEVFNFEGVPMIRHIKDGRVYKADMAKEGLERIVFTQYQGRWKDKELEGFLDIYAPEEED